MLARGFADDDAFDVWWSQAEARFTAMSPRLRARIAWIGGMKHARAGGP